MADLGVDVVIAGSQKALACPPGISLIVCQTGTAACRRTSYKMYVFEFERSFEEWRTRTDAMDTCCGDTSADKYTIT